MQVIWYYSKELFFSNFVLCTCICMYNLWKDKGSSSPETSIGKTKHTSSRGLFPEDALSLRLTTREMSYSAHASPWLGGERRLLDEVKDLHWPPLGVLTNQLCLFYEDQMACAKTKQDKCFISSVNVTVGKAKCCYVSEDILSGTPWSFLYFSYKTGACLEHTLACNSSDWIGLWYCLTDKCEAEFRSKTRASVPNTCMAKELKMDRKFHDERVHCTSI